MDGNLKHIVEIACLRGHKYIKGEATAESLPEKIAELGVFLLEKSNMIRTAGPSEEKIREELVEVQNKIDDLRRAIFSIKIKAR